MMTTLDHSHKPPQKVTSRALINAIWPGLPLAKHDATRYDRLCDYFDRELDGMENNTDFFALTGCSNIASVIKELIGTKSGIARGDAIDVARRVAGLGSAISEERVMRSVDTAVRIWLTLDVSSLDLRRPGLLAWTSKQTLVEVVQSHFTNLEREQSRTTSLDGDPDLDLKAEYLASFCGYEIIWTDNLASHLTIDWRHKTLTIYEHKISLYNHLRFPESSIIPLNVLEEAIDTLNLLFPFQDDATKRFLTKHKKPFYGLGMCNRPRKLKLSDYACWRSRVVDLVHISRSPVGPHQLRLSRRGDNFLQFANFWIATFVGILTLVSIVLGVAAIVYAVKQYELALEQYDISVLQLCIDPVAQERFPRVCSGVL